MFILTANFALRLQPVCSGLALAVGRINIPDILLRGIIKRQLAVHVCSCLTDAHRAAS